MRASRLVSLLLMLQARDRVTAWQLAQTLGVSVRTIYRDVQALSAAGVPVYGEAGPDGGYRLLAGYQTRLTGLDSTEAAALFLTGSPRAAADLGFSTASAAVRRKLQAALPSELRERAMRVADRVHLDTQRWYVEREPTPTALATIADATWQQRVVRIRYVRWTDPQRVSRSVQPHGLVVKVGTWYLIARHGTQFRTYCVSRILDAKLTGRQFERAADFDLAQHWARYLEDFERRRRCDRAVIRVSPHGLARMQHLRVPGAGHATPDIDSGSVTDRAAGWSQLEVPIESLDSATSLLLQFGADVEVLAPDDLRTELAKTAVALSRVYTERHQPSEREAAT